MPKAPGRRQHEGNPSVFGLEEPMGSPTVTRQVRTRSWNLGPGEGAVLEGERHPQTETRWPMEQGVSRGSAHHEASAPGWGPCQHTPCQEGSIRTDAPLGAAEGLPLPKGPTTRHLPPVSQPLPTLSWAPALKQAGAGLQARRNACGTGPALKELPVQPEGSKRPAHPTSPSPSPEGHEEAAWGPRGPSDQKGASGGRWSVCHFPGGQGLHLGGRAGWEPAAELHFLP